MLNGRGRPLRFLAVVAGCWAGLRVAMLWPEGASLPQAIEAAFPIAIASRSNAAPPVPPRSDGMPPVAVSGPIARNPVSGDGAGRTVLRSGARSRIDLAVLGLVHFGPEQPIDEPAGPGAVFQPVAQVVATPFTPPVQPATGRWQASGWVMTRRGAVAGGPMLGGDQLGVRIGYRADARRRITLYARATAPLGIAGRELAAGASWRPTRLPLEVAAEYRVGLDGTGSGPAIGVAGGVDGMRIPHGFRLEAYGQAGAIWRDRAEPFADAMLRVTRPLDLRPVTALALGGGVWGAAQRGAARLDVGPSAVARVPLGDRAVRVALDWRERVAGDARPGSGPALTIGADF
jgi:hypothetical protein